MTLSHSAYKRLGVWFLITISIFSLFRWLFGMAMPGAALEFATGITVLLVGGLLSGRYVGMVWSKASDARINKVIGILSVLAIIGCLLIGFFVNRMIDETKFNDFFFTVITLFLVSAFVAAMITLTRHKIRRNMRVAETALVQSRSELQLLQSQVSPHFLFNTLNNLYGLSITDHSKVPPLLIKLSDLLRYSVYDAKELFVPLRDEVQYLMNYIELEQMRLGDRLNLSAKFATVQEANVKIAPMLLIVFVENAFKHSRNNHDSLIYIELSLGLEGPWIYFSAMNSYSKVSSQQTINKHSGFGLDSVNKRLSLLYPDEHELQISDAGNAFSVNLKLQVK